MCASPKFPKHILSTPQYSIFAESKKLLEQVHKQEPAVGFTTTWSPNSNSGGTNTRAMVLVGFMSNEKLKVFKYGSLPMHVRIQYFKLIAWSTIYESTTFFFKSPPNFDHLCHREQAGFMSDICYEWKLFDGWIDRILHVFYIIFRCILGGRYSWAY